MSDSWLEHFEARLDLLEQATSQKEARFSSILNLAQSAFATIAAAPILVTYLVQPDEIQQLDSEGRAATPEMPETAIRTLLNARQSADTADRGFLSVHPLAEDVEFASHFTTDNFTAPLASCQEGAQAITAVMATYVSRHLLSQYGMRLASQAILMELVSQLSNSGDLSEAASIVVNDGANVLGNCRLTLLASQHDKLKAVAVTGVSKATQMSETLDGIERFVRTRISNNEPPNWLKVSDLATTDPSTAELFSQSNVKQLQILTPAEPSGVQTTTRCCLLVECFSQHGAPEPLLVQQLSNTCFPVIQKLVTAQQPWMSRFVSSRSIRRLLIAGFVLAVLAFWPADFEIEVAGQIQATNWQRIYAPDNGTIETVSFENESQIEEGTCLLKMSNPDVELRLQQVVGDIQTTLAKLASARTDRLIGNDPQASTNEQVLQTQLQNLEADRDLIQKQAESLIIKAPFAGTVFLRDPQNELTIRPVQRGQLLLQIVAKKTDWQLELDVPDQVRQYLVTHQQEASHSVPIRFMIKASPDQDWATTLTSIDNAVQVSGTELVCKATAIVSELPEIHQRPGTTVTARIYCGQRSVGFVWFREVIEFCQQLKFAWL